MADIVLNHHTPSKDTNNCAGSIPDKAAQMAHNYEIGTRAWQPDPTEGWVASELVSKTQDGDKHKFVFELADGEVRASRAAR